MNKKRIMVDMSATIIHHWHVRLLKKASEYWNVIVWLTTDEEILSEKWYISELNYNQRKEVLESIKYVSEVVPTEWLLTNDTLKQYNIDMLVHWDDNSNDIPKEKLLIFPRTKWISSTMIRKRVIDAIISKNNILSWNDIKIKLWLK